jgi:hypothetical protein
LAILGGAAAMLASQIVGPAGTAAKLKKKAGQIS